MKKLYSFTLILATLVLVSFNSVAQTTGQYIKIDQNTTWNSANKEPFLYGQCINCVIEIAPGATLTLAKNLAFTNTLFKGGKLLVNNNTLTVYNGAPTVFENIEMSFTGNARLAGSGPMVTANALMNFSDKSELNVQFTIDMTKTIIKLNGDAKMIHTGAGANLNGNSQIEIGDGNAASKAFFHMNGGRMNIFTGSKIMIATNNNKYKSWSPVYIMPENRAISFLSNNLNCGAGQPNRCAMDELYGPLMFDQKGIGPLGFLPVKLSAMSVKKDKQLVAISWTTAQEQQSDRFVIQRSANNSDWSEIGSVKSAGNSTIALNYHFVDRNPLNGQAFYRLKMIDIDGSVEYSPIKQLAFENQSSIKVFPNPSSDFVQVTTGDKKAAKIQLLGAGGQIVKEIIGQDQTTTISLNQFTSGSYFIRVIDQTGQAESFRLMIRK